MLIKFLALLSLWLASDCAALQERLSPMASSPPVTVEVPASALAELEALETADALIRLDNTMLGAQIHFELQTQAAAAAGMDFNHLRVQFHPQRITLEAELNAGDAAETVLGATVHGASLEDVQRARGPRRVGDECAQRAEVVVRQVDQGSGLDSRG